MIRQDQYGRLARPSSPSPILHAEEAIYPAIRHLEIYYPGFRSWFFGCVLPGCQKGSRGIFTQFDGNALAGVAIAKRDGEKKLCTLWVDPKRRVSGIGAQLAAAAFDWLGTEHPLFTIPDDRLREFRGLLNQWRFPPGAVVSGFYRVGHAEHVFNGDLHPLTSH